MGFLKLNRYDDPDRAEFDAAAVIEKVRNTFAGVHVVPGDQLALSADRAAVNGAAEHVVRTLRRNQRDYGPAFAFEIATDGKAIQGRARRFDVTFVFADPLTDEWRQRLLTFLHSLGGGRIEEADNQPVQS